MGIDLNAFGARPDYQRNASTTAATANGDYMVPIKDWPAMLAKLTDFDSDIPTKNVAMNLVVENYLLNHQGQLGEASIAALLEISPGMLNIYSLMYLPHLNFNHKRLTVSPHQTVVTIRLIRSNPLIVVNN